MKIFVFEIEFCRPNKSHKIKSTCCSNLSPRCARGVIYRRGLCVPTYTTSSLSFFLVRRAKRPRHANDHARNWRRERERHDKKETTRKARENGLSRSSFFFGEKTEVLTGRKIFSLLGLPPSFLASRGFAAQRLRAPALPLLNLKKKRDCSQSSSDPEGWFPLSRNFSVWTHVKFTRVNEIEAMYERPRVNAKVEQGSFLTCRRDLRNIVSILFTCVKVSCVRTEKLRDSGNPP